MNSTFKNIFYFRAGDFLLIPDGIASSRIAGIFPLNELPAALSVMSQNSSQGKILIRCDS
ncbi:hypothetical protein A6J64_013035 [Yersinia enterocolitica]|nr:hypothetical protein A6J64_013035 [Yersinia enterocolitica]PNM20386.1 hypothetical protein A6J65_016995 [Yersinia enterocolitica]PNM22292.1 hypothetical protein A6J63_005340 [Yersinia enterocolitica]RLY99804.1 hypothetical protein COO51_11360 [Yersinia enterocolitica]